MADFITDPRLSGYFDAVKKQSAQNAGRFSALDNGKEINKIVTRFHEGTPKWKMKKLRKLEEANLNLTGEVQMGTLRDTVAQLQQVIPNYDWKSIQDDMKTASSAADKLQMVEKYGAEIQNNVMPLLQQQMAQQQQAQAQQQQAQAEAMAKQKRENAEKQYAAEKETYMYHKRAEPKWKDIDDEPTYDSTANPQNSNRAFHKSKAGHWTNPAHSGQSAVINGEEEAPSSNKTISGLSE